ncbi:hypothetical protein GCM10027347_08440 [Larkinella harenae]
MKTVLLLFVIGLFSLTASAQDCLGMKFKSGASYEIQSFNPKDKLVNRMVYTVKDVRKEGGSTVVNVAVQSFDDKGKPAPEMAVTYTCTGTELIADLSGMIMATNDAMKDMEVRVKENKLVYPKQLGEGNKLPDGVLTAEMYQKGNKVMDIDFNIVNRMVDGKENLTTPAGTFNAYKVSSEVNMTNRAMGIPIRANFRSISYRADDVLFDLKTETYSKNGKLRGYTMMTKLAN